MKINDIERARTLAASLQAAIKRDTGHDIVRARCLDAFAAGCGVARWDMLPKAIKGQPVVFDPVLAGKALAAHGVPEVQAIAAAHGVIPRDVRHADAGDTRDVLSGRLGRQVGVASLAPKAGALVASAALAWLVRVVRPVVLDAFDKAKDDPRYRQDVPQALENEARALLVNPADPRLPGYIVLALCAWSRDQVDGARIDPHLNRSDEAMFAHTVLHCVKRSDAHALADACGQMPRAAQGHIVNLVAATLAGVLIDAAAGPGGIPAANMTPLSVVPLDDEPAPYGTLMRNWGPRWRRLDASDIVMIGERLGVPMLGRGWLKIVGDPRDADLAKIETRIDLGGEQGDVDDVAWVFGVGPHMGAITPVSALRYIRDASEERHLHIEIGEIGAGGDAVTSKAMGIVAGLQFGDDIQRVVERDGRVNVTINVISEGPDDVAEGRAIAAAEFASTISGMSATMNARVGRDTVTILGPRGTALAPLRPLDRQDGPEGIAESNDLIAIQTQIGDGWGSVVSVHMKGAPTIITIPNPANMPATKVAEIDAAIAGRERLDALLDAATDVVAGKGGEETVARILQLENARHAVLRRSPLGHAPDHDAVLAGQQIPAERTADAIMRLMGVMRNQGPAYERKAEPAHRRASPAGNPAMLIHILAELDEDDGDEAKMQRIAGVLETPIGAKLTLRRTPGMDGRVQMTAPGAMIDPVHMAKVFEDLMRAERPDFLECVSMGEDGMVTVEIDCDEGRARVGVMG